MANPGPWDTQGTAMSLADAIRAQAANQAKQASQKSGLVDTAPANPLDQLMQQIQNISVQATPYDQLMAQASGSAGAQFDPLIKALQGQMDTTTNRAHANQKQAQQMYGDLAKDIAGQMPEITNQMAQASNETQNRYDQTQQSLQGEYDKQAQTQADLYKKLGIQAAAPEASQQAMTDQAYFQNQNKSDEAAAMQLLDEMKNADVSYNQQSSNNTRLAGDNAAQDIGTQLEDYLSNANGKMEGLQAGRSSAVSSLLSQLQQQDAQRVTSQEDKQYNQLMDMFNLQLKMQQMSQDSQASPLFKGTNGPSGASNYLSEIYGGGQGSPGGDSFSSNAIMNSINSVMENPAVLAGSYDSGQKDQYGQPVMNKVNDAYLRKLLTQQMTSDQGPLTGTQFSSADINNAINALLAYQGKLK